MMTLWGEVLAENHRVGIKFKVVVRRAVSRQQTANINAQYQKQSDIKTAWKSTGGDQVQGFDHGGLPIGESALQLSFKSYIRTIH